MTKKVTLIGSSHAGAMKYGWDEIGADHPGIDLTYVVSPRDVLTRLSLTKTRVYGAHRDSGLSKQQRKALEARSGGTRFDLKEADVVLLVGTNPDPAFLRHLLGQADVDGLRALGAPTRLSRPAFDAILDDYTARILPTANWRNWDSPQLIYVDTPRRSEMVLEVAEMNRPENPEGYAAIFDMASDRLGAALEAAGIAYLAQPRDTIAENGLSKAEFNVGSSRFQSGRSHSERDTTHMNGAYGVRVWQDILARIA